MRRRDRIAQAASLLRGLSLTGEDVIAVLSGADVPHAWWPCQPDRMARVRESIRTHYPDVRLVWLRGNQDYCGYTTSPTRIAIALHMPETVTLDTIAHELAHAKCLDIRGEDQHHGPHWGVAYAEAYALIHEDHT